ncbi:unnamed protein product [Closterium sp. NIES-53]
MTSLRVLAFDHDGRPVQFDTRLDDLQLYLLSDSKDSVSQFDLASGAATAPSATADSSARSQWLTRDAAARLAIRNHLPIAECAHFGQHRIAQALYDAVVARYSSRATAALGRLLLPYLFPDLYHFLSLDPTSLTVDLLEQHLLAAETSAVAVGAARGTPRQPFFEGCSPSPLAPSYASAAAVDVSVPEDVGAASASAKRRSSKGKGGRGSGGGSGGGGGGSRGSGGGSSGGGGGGGTGGGSGGPGGGGGGSGGSDGGGGGGTGGGGTGARRVGSRGGQRQQQQHRSETPSPQPLRDRAGQTCGRLHTQHRCFSRLDDAWRAEFGDDVELPCWADLLKSRIAIFDLDLDAILSAMYALSTSTEGDCYWCVPPNPGIAAAALRASAPAEALHTFTLDSGASCFFFRDSTTLTPLPASFPVTLADPSGGPVVARSSTVLPCPAVPSGSLSGLHLPSFSTNLVSTVALQDAMFTITTPWGSSLYTLATEPPHVAASAQVPASGQVAASCSCRLLSHQTLLWHHRLGHPSLPRLCGMHSLLLVSGLPRSLPPLPPVLRPSGGDPDAPDIPTLRSYAEAITSPYSSQWQAAMDAEMASWKSTDTYVDEVPPPGANIVDGMSIFRRDYELHSLDFSTAFLQGSLHEEIWLRRPPGFTGTFPAGTQWSLRRPVHGLRQAPREWHDTLRTTLAALGFAPSTADPSLFLRTGTSLPLFYVLVYVDDFVFATADTEALTLVKFELQKRHTCTDLGELRSYLGLLITRDRARRTITLTQSHMVHQVLQRFGFQFSSPQPTPLSTSHSLSAPPSDKSVESSGPYPELVGCLMYLMTCTRPDLAYPLNLLARYVAPGRHRKVHWDAAKRVLRYLCSTSGMGLVLGGRGPVVLTGHADPSWVDDSATQRSSQGYIFSLGSGSVSWQSTRSSSVLSYSCEAEIYVGAMAAQELRWLTFLLTDLGEQPRSPPVLYVDNKAMIALGQEHRVEHRTKHITLRYFLARELQQRGQLRLAYVASRANTADVFAKALPPACFAFLDWSCDHLFSPTLPMGLCQPGSNLRCRGPIALPHDPVAVSHMHFFQSVARVAQLHQQAGFEVAQRAKSADAQLATSADPISEQAGSESAVEEVGATTVFHGDNDGEIHRGSHSDRLGEQRADNEPPSASPGVDIGREAEGENPHPTVQMERLAMDIGHPSQRSLDERLKEGDVEALEVRLASIHPFPALPSPNPFSFPSPPIPPFSFPPRFLCVQISMESRRAFEEAWQGVIAAGGEEKLSPPKEIVWLNGAPGAGKGANTPFILRTRGFEARAIQVSDLLGGNEDVAAIMRSGGLVSDSMVLQIVLQPSGALGEPPGASGEPSVGDGRLPGTSANTNRLFSSSRHVNPDLFLPSLSPPQRILTRGNKVYRSPSFLCQS